MTIVQVCWVLHYQQHESMVCMKLKPQHYMVKMISSLYPLDYTIYHIPVTIILLHLTKSMFLWLICPKRTATGLTYIYINNSGKLDELSKSCLSAKQIPNAWYTKTICTIRLTLNKSQKKIPYYLEAKCNMNGTQSRNLKIWTSIKFIIPEWHYRRVLWRKITKYQLISLAGSKEKNRISSAVHYV